MAQSDPGLPGGSGASPTGLSSPRRHTQTRLLSRRHKPGRDKSRRHEHPRWQRKGAGEGPLTPWGAPELAPTTTACGNGQTRGGHRKGPTNSSAALMAPKPTVLWEMSELRGCLRDCPLPFPLLVPPLHGPAASLLQHPCAGTSTGIQQELGAAGALQSLVPCSSVGAKHLMLWSSIQGTATVNNCQLKLVHREKFRQQEPTPYILAHDSHAFPAPLRKDHGWKVQTWDSPG